MDRARLVAAVWERLTTFRAIAETEHLPTAAKRLGVTPPALSRSLRLLEEEVGRPLFYRVGRRIELAPEGELLLQGVRDAMRRVHDALEQVSGDAMIGPVRIAAAGVLLPYVADAAATLHGTGLRPEILELAPSQWTLGLLDGRIDVAFSSAGQSCDGVICERLGDVARWVCASPTHPLAGAPLPDGRHGFAAPTPGESGERDGWDGSRPRQVVVRVARPSTAAHLCRSGTLLAVLTDRLAEAYALERLEPAAACEVWVLRRERLVDRTDRADAVIRALRDQLQ